MQTRLVNQLTACLKAYYPVALDLTASKVAPKLFAQLHQPSLRADAVTTRTKSRLAGALIVQLLPLIEQIATYDKETILLAMRRLPVCRPWAAPPQSCFRAETIRSPTGDWGV